VTSTSVRAGKSTIAVSVGRCLTAVVAGEKRWKGCIDHRGQFSALRNPAEMALF